MSEGVSQEHDSNQKVTLANGSSYPVKQVVATYRLLEILFDTDREKYQILQAAADGNELSASQQLKELKEGRYFDESMTLTPIVRDIVLSAAIANEAINSWESLGLPVELITSADMKLWTNEEQQQSSALVNAVIGRSQTRISPGR